MGAIDDEWGPVWLTRLKARDTAAFARLVEWYERPLYNVAYRMLGNAAEAADIVQDVFLKAFENMASYDPNYRLFSWIYRIAVNESLDRLKHHRRTDAVSVAIDDLPLASAERGPEQRVRDAQTHDLIEAALLQISDDYRAVIILRHFSDCSYDEMAEILHVPAKTVKSRLYSARQELRGQLCARGVTTA